MRAVRKVCNPGFVMGPVCYGLPRSGMRDGLVDGRAGKRKWERVVGAFITQLVAVAADHARLESTQDLEGLMGTMEGEPVYEFHPLGKCFKGMANTRRYYEHFMANVQQRILGAEMISESIGSSGVVEEYNVTVQHDGDAGPTVHRIMAILTFGEQALSGERMYSDEKFFRFLVGPLWNELEPMG